MNGVRLPASAVISLEVTNASHFTADTYRLELSVAGLPAALGPDYWASSQNDRISLGVSLSGETPTPLILGQVDDAGWGLTGRTITLSGRDLSSVFIDNKTAEKYQNQTAGQIAATLAARRGLNASVQDTSTLAGTYYQIDHAVAAHEMTEWDLLTYLAQREGFDVWVAGETLNFAPPPLLTADPYVLLWSEPGDGSFASNATDIRLNRSQTLARDVVVEVRSWNQKQQASFVVKAKRSQVKKSQRSGGQAQIYSFIRPNLTREQARQFAETRADEITRHERLLSASLPGDNTLSTRAPVRMAGTGTDFDQLYYPDRVSRRLSLADGYRMEFSAKNHSTQDEVLA